MEILGLFQSFGEVTSFRLFAHSRCAFITYGSVSSAFEAARQLEGHQLGSMKLTVNLGRTSRHLWVGNLSPNVTAVELCNAFARFGPIESVRMLTAKRCGFVNFERTDHARIALETMNGVQLGDHNLVINFQWTEAPAPRQQPSPAPPTPPSPVPATTTTHLPAYPHVVAANFSHDQRFSPASPVLGLSSTPSYSAAVLHSDRTFEPAEVPVLYTPVLATRSPMASPAHNTHALTNFYRQQAAPHQAYLDLHFSDEDDDSFALPRQSPVADDEEDPVAISPPPEIPRSSQARSSSPSSSTSSTSLKHQAPPIKPISLAPATNSGSASPAYMSPYGSARMRTSSFDETASPSSTQPPRTRVKRSASVTSTGPVPSRQLFVGNLSPETSVQDLFDLFSIFGHIDSVKVFPSRAYAFVIFHYLQHAMAARDQMQPFPPLLHERILNVDYGRPVTQQPRSSPLSVHRKRVVRDGTTSFMDRPRPSASIASAPKHEFLTSSMNAAPVIMRRVSDDDKGLVRSSRRRRRRGTRRRRNKKQPSPSSNSTPQQQQE